MPVAVLEFKAADEAWYAGTAELEGSSLRVHFEHFPVEEDEIWPVERFKSPEDVRKMVRRASQPMQDTQCSNLRAGMLLCIACRRLGFFQYFDARLQQCLRVPHILLEYGQEECKCEFEVEWLSGPARHERQFVACGDICLRTYGNIEEDPIIKEYIMKIKSFRGLKSTSSIVTTEGHTGLISNKRQSTASNDEKRHNEKPHPKRLILNTMPRNRNLEPSSSCRLSNVIGTVEIPVNVIQIDSDKEEEPATMKNALPAKTAEAFNHFEFEEEKAVNNDKQAEATSSIPQKTFGSPVVDELNMDDFCEISQQHMFSCEGSVAGCSCMPMQKHHFRNKSCNCNAVGFVPISMCQLTKMCSHRKCNHRSCKRSYIQARSGHACAFPPSSRGCCKVDLSQACKTQQRRVLEECGDTVEDIRDEDMKGLFHYLHVQNLEIDISPSKALKAVQKVSSGAITVYIWPSLEYETVRRGDIFYQDSKAAEAALQSFAAGKFVVMSSKGRPWVVSRARGQRSDRIQPYNIMAAGGAMEEEGDEAGEEAERGDLLIVQRGTEEYTVAVGRQKLFMMQQVKLRQCYAMFRAEEEKYSAAVLAEKKENP